MSLAADGPAAPTIAASSHTTGTSTGLKLDAGTTLTFGYAGEYASDARDHGLRAELRIEF